MTETLLDWYYECLEGDYRRLEKLRATSSQRRASVVKVCVLRRSILFTLDAD